VRPPPEPIDGACPPITIGITCFREGEWLRSCWESVLAQTDDRWEAVLVMDGGDHQPTREVFDALEHPRLCKLALTRNVGPYPTRNEAFRLTRTPYHLYLDGDDMLRPDAVALLLECIDRHPEAAVIYGDYERFDSEDPKGSPVDYWRCPRRPAAEDFVRGQPIPAGSAYRVADWEALGGFADELAWGNADYDFMIGVFEAGYPVAHCGAAHYRYRLGGKTKVSTSYERRYHETHRIMVERHPRFFADRKLRGRFLAAGERRSAVALARAGEHAQAASLAFAASRHGRRLDAGMWSTLARSRIAPVAQHALEAARRRLTGRS
jgi:glycosyltransferase involved in cell wall biosynthesis